MQTDDRPWLPTTPRERVFLFSLSLSLMLNLTVVLLLVTGDLPVLADLQAKPTAALAEQDVQGRLTDPVQTAKVIDTVDRPSTSPWIDASEPVFTDVPEPRVAEVLPFVEETFEPAPIVSVAPPATSPDPIEPVQQAQPKQDDEPATFFGIELE